MLSELVSVLVTVLKGVVAVIITQVKIMAHIFSLTAQTNMVVNVKTTWGRGFQTSTLFGE